MNSLVEANSAETAEPATTELFAFESDFASTLRCIPMAVRYKLDQCGVKLSLRQWASFSLPMKNWLARSSTDTQEQIARYRNRLCETIRNEVKEEPVFLDAQDTSDWSDGRTIPQEVINKTRESHVALPDRRRWRRLSPLQRFAIVKLTRANHENANFLPAMREFGLLR